MKKITIIDDDGEITFEYGGLEKHMFTIKIDQEGDLSVDGGHSFEDIIADFSLTQSQARELSTILNEYLGQYDETK